MKSHFWQISADYLIRRGETAENFLWKTVPSLVEEGLIQMGFDESDISLIEARPHTIFLCERGGSYQFDEHHQPKPGIQLQIILNAKRNKTK